MLRVTFEGVLETGTHGRGTYTWITADEETADLLEAIPVPRIGFQAIKVRATVGTTSWDTSVFPSNGSYLLLISKKLRAAETLETGDAVTVHLDVVGT
ncbi:MAG: DUF1905 domain-containing protein [Cellulomonadaceae bacterium]|jgi:hypothetical protein|nr:DUF1905 domain-containing protein [Cellulomonadaceae bacterium]